MSLLLLSVAVNVCKAGQQAHIFWHWVTPASLIFCVQWMTAFKFFFGVPAYFSGVRDVGMPTNVLHHTGHA